jgi:hypothetical protein
LRTHFDTLPRRESGAGFGLVETELGDPDYQRFILHAS